MIRVRQIKVDILLDQENNIKRKVSKLLRLDASEFKYKIVKRSLDARHDNLCFVYELNVETKNDSLVLSKINSKDCFMVIEEEYVFPSHKELDERPIIVGSGPAGLFCAYILAENNYRPVIIERGEKVEDRVKSIEEFWETNKLNPNSNVQFGEGGAGTFSDGKLNTLVKDKFNRGKKAFQIFVENGAPEEIMYVNNPHIGTDLLRKVIINIRNKIISMGGEFRYNTTLTDINVVNDKLESITLNEKEVIKCSKLILAIGHSARDTFKMLYDKNINMIAKPFAIGLRIEHPQEMINICQYGTTYYKLLPPASYKLAYQSKNGRGVYSFCMCPGGYVVNASSEVGHLAINGMSNHLRDSKNANSALIVTISPNDFGKNPLDGIKLQRELEKRAYELGNGNIPVQLYKDFVDNKPTTSLGNVEVLTKGNYTLTNLNLLLPNCISESIKEGIEYFSTKIKGFNRSDAVLLGIESRTSSPLRIVRDENLESSIKGIFPIGEGAGYAGGITTSAMDGIKAAEAVTRI